MHDTLLYLALVKELCRCFSHVPSPHQFSEPFVLSGCKDPSSKRDQHITSDHPLRETALSNITKIHPLHVCMRKDLAMTETLGWRGAERKGQDGQYQTTENASAPMYVESLSLGFGPSPCLASPVTFLRHFPESY